ncbi:VWA domain-containing protein [Caldicellulosiruptor morganii]|uniref:VWA domain-containing protein n=1 Tax=Caldicellulosiruptor morganii TaxID=1387555 RepID=A0ABY7BNQ6_9FIRM|nr:VWA domain-containing protein [Caldicellulosiruptor morganii]WAM34448.1 VWA domain-containing protein [Caldicellulosiruptor morganii]
MKKNLKKLLTMIILCAFTMNILIPYFVKAESLPANTSAYTGATPQDTSLIKSPRQILFEQIERLSGLPEPFYDQKPSYDEKIKQVKIALIKALNFFDSDTTIFDRNFFDYVEKAVRKLKYYLHHGNLKKDIAPTINEIRTSCILAAKLVVENLKKVCEENESIFTQKQKKEFLKAVEEYNKGCDFENKKNNEQAIHFYRNSWERLNQLKKAIFQLQDKDSDSCPDFLEEKFGLKTNKKDTDGDNLSDFFEVLKLFNLTDGKSIDTDRDGIPDSQEDPDEDKLVNIEEQRFGTDPLLPDTDGDGLDDYFEIFTFKSSPLKIDTDEDGLLDKSEYLLGTDPNTPDTDQDGIFDGLEEYKQVFTDKETGAKVEITAEGDISEFVTTRNLSNEEIFQHVYGLVSEPVDFEVYVPFKEATVYIPIDTTKVPNGDIQNVKMFYFDENLMTFVPLDEQGVDVEKKLVWAKTDHFTTFVLFYIPTWKAVWEVPINKGEREVSHQTKYIDIVFVLDSSGSMSWNDPNDYRKTAAKSFVDALVQGDRAAVVDFDSYGYLLQPLTHDFEAVKSAIDRIDSSGGTDIAAGIRIANQQLISQSSDDRIKVIILLTDGEGYYDQSLTAQAKDSNINIYTIGLGTSVDENLLRNIAAQTGGMYFSVSSASQLPQVFSRITEIVTEPVDTDGDGIPDSVEVSGARTGFGTLVYSDPNNPDTDGDGIEDGEEIGVLVNGPNGEYYKSSTNPAIKDSDQDGLFDAEEDEYGTKPYNSDTDGDGLSDGIEVSMGYSPLHKNYDGDSYTDKEEAERGLDPYLYDKTWFEHIKDILAGATCGDAGEILVKYGILAERTLKSLGYLIGQIASGFIPFSNIRDAVASLVKLDFAGVFTNLLASVPGAGNIADVIRGFLKFIGLGDECIKIAARLIYEKFDAWRSIFASDVFMPVFALLSKGKDNLKALEDAVEDRKFYKAVPELAQHNCIDEVAECLNNAKDKIILKEIEKIQNIEDIETRVNKYMIKNNLKSEVIKAERFAVEAAVDYFTSLGYICVYKAPHGVKGPDLVFRKGDDYLIVEAKGAVDTTKNPTVGSGRLFNYVKDEETGVKEKFAQLSWKWLSTNSERYLGVMKREMDPVEFEKFKKFLRNEGQYEAAVVYAAKNEKIKWDGGIAKYLKEAVANNEHIKSMTMIKMTF